MFVCVAKDREGKRERESGVSEGRKGGSHYRYKQEFKNKEVQWV
jgi:hypothetical protein